MYSRVLLALLAITSFCSFLVQPSPVVPKAKKFWTAVIVMSHDWTENCKDEYINKCYNDIPAKKWNKKDHQTCTIEYYAENTDRCNSSPASIDPKDPAFNDEKINDATQTYLNLMLFTKLQAEWKKNCIQELDNACKDGGECVERFVKKNVDRCQKDAAV